MRSHRLVILLLVALSLSCVSDISGPSFARLKDLTPSSEMGIAKYDCYSYDGGLTYYSCTFTGL